MIYAHNILSDVSDIEDATAPIMTFRELTHQSH